MTSPKLGSQAEPTVGPLKHKTPTRHWLLRLGVTLALLWNIPLLAAALPTGSVTLAWYPSPSPDVAGYKVYYGVASGSYTKKVSAGNTDSVTLSNLVAGTTYYFVVTCFDIAGDESLPSNEASYTVPEDLTGMPVALENPALSGGSFSFTVSDAPGTNFAVEASVDLVNWVRVATNTAPFTFVDPDASQFEKRFYRTVTLPDLTPADPNGTPTPTVLGNPSLSGGNYSFTVPGPADVSIVVEASADLIHWIPVQTNTAPFTFVDADASQYTQRFYRTVTLPNVTPADPNGTPTPTVLGNPSLSGGNYSFTVPGPADVRIVVEASVDLIHWIPVQTNTAPFTFVDADAGKFAQRFYRTATFP